MIESTTLDIMNSFEAEVVKQALATLARSGVIELQIRLETERLVSGNQDESPVVLADQILRLRARHHSLIELQEMGLQCEREISK